MRETQLLYKKIEVEVEKKVKTKGKIEIRIPKHFHLIEISENRDNNFKKLIDKELYFSLFSGRGRWNNSLYIKPSIFNNRNDNFLKNEISKFDWILLTEFYNNKDLKLYGFYRTDVIPILSESIYKK